jgi:hypothetical protein
LAHSGGSIVALVKQIAGEDEPEQVTMPADAPASKAILLSADAIVYKE